MQRLTNTLADPSAGWAILYLPLLQIAGTAPSDRLRDILVHSMDEWSARLLIASLMITSLTIPFRGTAPAALADKAASGYRGRVPGHCGVARGRCCHLADAAALGRAARLERLGA